MNDGNTAALSRHLDALDRWQEKDDAYREEAIDYLTELVLTNSEGRPFDLDEFLCNDSDVYSDLGEFLGGLGALYAVYRRGVADVQEHKAAESIATLIERFVRDKVETCEEAIADYISEMEG